MRLSLERSAARAGKAGKSSPALFLLSLIGLALHFFVSGCVTRQVAIEEVKLPLTTIRQVVERAIPGGVREQSQNGRELSSYYFSTKSFEEDAEEKPERNYAKVLVLGNSRPYRIDVKVIREKKIRGSASYQVVGVDELMTDELIQTLKQGLADRREDRSIIDGFRPY